MTNQHVDHEAHAKLTKEYQTHIDDVRSRVRAVQGTVEAMGAGWQGDANKAFNDFHDRFQQAAQKLHTRLDAASAALTKGNQHLGTTDSDSTQHFTKLTTL